MANVAHASLTGSELHEPKGADSAALGTVYVSDGAGSGSWQSVGTSAFTGMIADFPAPVAPSGWLECDGSVISTSTYAGLFAVLSITSSGAKTNGSPIITSIASTTNMKVGYYVFGTGIASGTTILSVDSASQITLSANSSSTGTSAFYVSPFLMNTGTIKLPDFTTDGRYRRSRTSSTKVGETQASANVSHTHTLSGTTGSESAHTHTYSGNTGTESAAHTHTTAGLPVVAGNNNNNGGGGGAFAAMASTTSGYTSGTESVAHTHGYSGTTAAGSAHTHSFSTTSDASGGTETRPLTMVVMTCIKT